MKCNMERHINKIKIVEERKMIGKERETLFLLADRSRERQRQRQKEKKYERLSERGNEKRL